MGGWHQGHLPVPQVRAGAHLRSMHGHTAYKGRTVSVWLECVVIISPSIPTSVLSLTQTVSTHGIAEISTFLSFGGESQVNDISPSALWQVALAGGG